jgi:hypothetical protein
MRYGYSKGIETQLIKYWSPISEGQKFASAKKKQREESASEKFRGDYKALLGLTFALRGLHPTKPKVVRLASSEPPVQEQICLPTNPPSW